MIIFRFRTRYNFVSITEYYYSVTKLLTKSHSSISYKFYLLGVVSNLRIRNREIHPYIERLSFPYNLYSTFLLISTVESQKMNVIKQKQKSTLVCVMDNEKINDEGISALPQ